MTCEVIRDLLPLCADNVASQESRAAVEEHIRTCDECRALYESMCAPVEATEVKAPDYMDAVRQQKKENRRFILRVYGVALGIALLFGAMWLVGKMLDYEGWRYETIPISLETVEKEMPQAKLTREEKDLAEVVFSLPEVREELETSTEPYRNLPEEVYHYLLAQVSIDPDSLTHGYAGISGSMVILDYYNDEYRCILEFYDADQSGHADLLRKSFTKMIPKRSENGIFVETSSKEPVYVSQINAAMINAVDTGSEEKNEQYNEQYEEYYTTYEKTVGKREWLAFLKYD